MSYHYHVFLHPFEDATDVRHIEIDSGKQLSEERLKKKAIKEVNKDAGFEKEDLKFIEEDWNMFLIFEGNPFFILSP